MCIIDEHHGHKHSIAFSAEQDEGEAGERKQRGRYDDYIKKLLF
jgi:hypothetical protein